MQYVHEPKDKSNEADAFDKHSEISVLLFCFMIYWKDSYEYANLGYTGFSPRVSILFNFNTW